MDRLGQYERARFPPHHPELAKLPGLPAYVSYYDDFGDKRHTILDPASSRCWSIRAGGIQAQLRFDRFGPVVGLFLKH